MRKKFYPPFRVDQWFERDRASVVVYDSRDNVVAEWWDEEVDDMVESGFFKPQFSRKSPIDPYSVIDYLKRIKVI